LKGKEPEKREPVEMPTLEEPKKVAKTTHREFGGAIGAFFMLILLPCTVYGLNLMCDKVGKKLMHFGETFACKKSKIHEW
jgi:hypothetical protein